MKMHVSGEQFAEALDGSAGADTRAHLAQCPACAAELRMLQAALKQMPQQAEQAAQRDETFWRAQRLAIYQRVTQAPGPRATLHWALALAALLLFAVLLNQPATESALRAGAQLDPDHELLLQVEETVNRRVPAALAPADLLVAELNSAVKAETNR
jgi:hypothetical protein